MSDFIQLLIDELRRTRDITVTWSLDDGHLVVTDPRGEGCPVELYLVDGSLNGKFGQVRFDYLGEPPDVQEYVRLLLRDVTSGVHEVAWARHGRVVKAVARFGDGSRMTWRSSVVPGGVRSERRYPPYGIRV